MKLHDGSICTLSDIRYILDLKKNLISLSTLESKGYCVMIESRPLTVTKGDMIVMRSTRLNNLYFLKESTMIGGVATICNDIGEDASDTTKLWHMRLGHTATRLCKAL